MRRIYINFFKWDQGIEALYIFANCTKPKKRSAITFNERNTTPRHNIFKMGDKDSAPGLPA